MTKAGQLLREGHSPSACMMSGGVGISVAMAAGFNGQALAEIDIPPCKCPCQGCQQGKCGRMGNPPLTDEERVAARAEAARRQRKRWAKQRVFHTWDLPPERTVESFRFVVDEVYDDYGDGLIGIEDTYLTDHPSERDRLVANILESFNDARVTERAVGSDDDQVTWHRAPEGDDA